MPNTQTNSRSAAQASNMLTIVESALLAKDRLPAAGRNPHRHDVTSFHLDAQPGGWAAIITFERERAGTLKRLGTPPKIYPTKKEAFLAGAETLCRILTGSKTLPFFIDHGDNLIVTGFGTGGFRGSFMMKMPAPWV
ncbi:hypothetical protein LCGC14_1923530 [marine sediment metagenome]|uniref:Uncharacterized protein n=1 Tax=marine sediment metagenome TaxID=412755 RepID=A0A0F9I3Z4_9ZZZZ